MSHAFHVVDVFAERPYTGNPLAVVLDAGRLGSEEMLRIAREMNHSETAFVPGAPEPGGAWRVRVFTPAREIAFAGHPILGAAWIIRRHLGEGRPATVALELPVGRVPVTFEPGPGGRDVAWLQAPPVTLGPVCDPSRMAAAVGLEPGDLDPQFPVRQATAGVSAMLVPLRGRKALARCRLDLAAYAPLAREGRPALVYLFCPETREPGNHLSARFFFEAHGVREDPAAGNATAFLGAYLLEHRYFPQDELSLRIEQGHETGRPSLLLLRARKEERGLDLRVGGQVIPAAQGVLL
jgi:trans-2,3-dihydro-3-hydroxyanthranilate isomerase